MAGKGRFSARQTACGPATLRGTARFAAFEVLVVQVFVCAAQAAGASPTRMFRDVGEFRDRNQLAARRNCGLQVQEEDGRS